MPLEIDELSVANPDLVVAFSVVAIDLTPNITQTFPWINAMFDRLNTIKNAGVNGKLIVLLVVPSPIYDFITAPPPPPEGGTSPGLKIMPPPP